MMVVVTDRSSVAGSGPASGKTLALTLIRQGDLGHVVGFSMGGGEVVR